MTNTHLLEEIIEQSGYKKSYLAAVLDITPAAFSQKIHGDVEFKASEIMQLCSVLKIRGAKKRDAIFFAKKR